MAKSGADLRYQILFARSARKELEGLPSVSASRALDKIERLAMTPRPAGSRKLVGSGNLWRLRVGDYRIIYAIDDSKRMVDVTAIRHRSDAYR